MKRNKNRSLEPEEAEKYGGPLLGPSLRSLLPLTVSRARVHPRCCLAAGGWPPSILLSPPLLTPPLLLCLLEALPEEHVVRVVVLVPLVPVRGHNRPRLLQPKDLALRIAERFQHRWGVRAREGRRSRAREGFPVEAEPGGLP